MKIINRFNSLKTWQKFGIGVAILTAFKYFFMNGFIINVKAESSTLPNVIISDSITGSNYSGSITTASPYKSNFIAQNTLNSLANSGGVPMKVANNVSFIKDSDSTFVDLATNTYTLTSSAYSSFYERTGQTGYYNGFYFYRDDTPGYIKPINKHHYYSFLFEFYTNNVEWTSNSYTRESFDINATYRYYNSNTSSAGVSQNLMNKIDISDFAVYVPGMTYTDQHYGYILFSFYTNDLYPDSNHSSSSNTYYYFESLELSLRNTEYDSDDVVDMSNYKYLFKSSNGGGYKFSNVYLLDDVDVFVGDQSYTSTMGGTYLNQTIYENCDPLDISCHVRNILTGVKSFTNNLIYNTRVLFNYLFIPDFTLIDDHIDYLQEVIDDKYPDVQALIDYKDYFFERMNNISPQHTISFSGASLPGYNVNIIPAFTYNFDDVITNNTFAPYYNILRAILTVILCLAYCLFVFKTFSRIFNKSGGGD